MTSVRALQPRRRPWIRFTADIAAIFLVATASSAQSKPATPASQQAETPWAKDLNKYPGLLPEIGQLVGRLQSEVQFPGPRAESRLLPLLPEPTIVYASFPNYGEATQQALQVFRQELQESAVLRDWWTHGGVATEGPQIEDAVEKLCQFQQYLGDEIVFSGVMDGKEPRFLLVAEVRKPGLKKFLGQVLEQLAAKSKPGVRLLDPQELATFKEKPHSDEFLVLVRPDFFVGASDLATLRSFSARLDRGGHGFVSTAFGKRIMQEYNGGLTVVAAADLNTILKQVPHGKPQEEAAFQRSGFADMKYLIWDHRKLGTQEVSQAELSFTVPRHGAASWLAKPLRLGSLDFVSPQAMLTGTVVLTSLSQIFDDIQEMAGPSNTNAFAGIAAGEKALGLSLKDDLLNLLGGELTVELDSINPPKPAWKAMLNVRDAARLQHTLETLLALGQLKAEQFEEGGTTYHSVRVPSSPAPMEIAYAFADGYLIAGSSHEAVSEAVALHRSGGSLAKSGKFLASLPGHSANASALLYQNAGSMAALQMQRIAPELADTLAKLSKEASPTVFSVYGEESAIREMSSSGSFDVPTTLIVAAIAIPNLLRSRMAANETSAVGSVRTVNTAQVTYEAMYPKRGFAPNLATLGPDPRGPNANSPEHADLIDQSLANAACAGDAWCTKSGYQFRINAMCKLRVCKEYVVVATPVNSNSGTRSFCSTSDGVIHLKVGLPLTSPVSASECRAWPPIQ